jgi:hypothetical protein
MGIFKHGVLVLFLLNSLLVFSEDYVLNIPQSSLTISGTSNLHEWSMKANNLECSGNFISGSQGISAIKDLAFSCKVKDIKSGNSIMDSKTYNALKESKNPVITYKLLSVEQLHNSNNSFNGIAKGELTIAGVKKIVQVPFSGNVLSNQIRVQGSINLKMSDFNVDKPTFMFGAFKTGDDVKIDYLMEFKK